MSKELLVNDYKRLFSTPEGAKKHILKNSTRVGNELHLKQGVSVFQHSALKDKWQNNT